MKPKFIKLIGIICAVACFASACTQADSGEATESDTKPTETVTEGATENVETPYWKLQCRTIKSKEDIHFDLGSNYNLALSFSKDWTLEKIDGGYDIKRESNTIGKISLSKLDSAEWTVVDDFSRTLNSTLTVKKFIEKKGEGERAEYRYRFEYNCNPTGTPTVVSLCLNYVELDANAADRLYKQSNISAPTTVQNGMLSKVKDGNYLILGNSFISSSDIGSILTDMFSLNNKNVNFNAVSRGYAQVGTYTSDSGMMSSIESGNYDAVFICGFYANAEANNLVLLENACKKSNTELIIFPAHNEFEEPIKMARNKCPNLKFLDWRGELNMLIDSGVDKWDLCWNDQHLHSTEYAGLIGAHMIYRAIYGEIPNVDGMYSINIDKAKNMFGDYLTTGCVKVDYEVVKFN